MRLRYVSRTLLTIIDIQPQFSLHVNFLVKKKLVSTFNLPFFKTNQMFLENMNNWMIRTSFSLLSLYKYRCNGPASFLGFQQNDYPSSSSIPVGQGKGNIVIKH